VCPLDHEQSARRDSFRVGVDIGGTFTDVIIVGTDGSFRQIKVPSTPSQFEQAIVRGVSQLLRDTNLQPETLSTVIHGTTIATNALLEGRGTATALLTTQGFRDVLELGRLRYPALHDLSWEKPKSLVPRRYRLEVAERINAKGEIEQPLDLDQVADLVVKVRQQGIQSIAVCFINSYINPLHEKQVSEMLRSQAPDLHVSASFEILPEIKEYERTSTTVVNAYIHPIVDTYLGNLENELHSLEIHCPLLIMQSTGGLVDAGTARAKPVQLVESGPAAGVTAALPPPASSLASLICQTSLPSTWVAQPPRLRLLSRANPLSHSNMKLVAA
jgi:N-methylhydantoinase A